MDEHPYIRDARNLEEEFFAKENRQLLQQLREKKELENRRATLREVLPNADDALLDHLFALGIRPETALAVILVPLTVVAWADGKLEPKEREVILRAAEERGVKAGSPARELLESWLARQPGAEVVAAWKRYVKGLSAGLGEEERRGVRESLLAMARGVARAEGGVLGLGSKVSAAERAALEDLERSLSE